MNITDHKILVFTEYAYTGWGEPVPGAGGTYRVSTRKLDEFKLNHEFEYGYVEDLINDALVGKTHIGTGRKYSFGDGDGWYTALQPDADCDDPEVEIEVTVG
jgi:hypothetical protein